MTTAKHTPGPWHRNIPPAHRYPTIYAGRNTHVVSLATIYHGGKLDETEMEANCALIAAAPDLLAAAKDALESLRRLPDRSHPPAYRVTCMGQLERAIAKAEGREGREDDND